MAGDFAKIAVFSVVAETNNTPQQVLTILATSIAYRNFDSGVILIGRYDLIKEKTR